MVFLCGSKPERSKITASCLYQIKHPGDFRLQPKNWAIYYLGEGKQGFCLPWQLLSQCLAVNPHVRHFILSDADEQIALGQIGPIGFNDDAYLVLPQRIKRHFGRLTLERSLIEDIENAFLRVKMKDRMKVLDFQPGVFIGRRELFEAVSLDGFSPYKWSGDILLIDQMITQGMTIGMIEVASSDDHGTSTIFDYTREFKEMLNGPPLVKMKELVDHSGISLNDMTRIMLDAPQEYIFTLFKYSDEDNTNVFDYYMTYITDCYHQVAAESGITL